MGCAESQPLHRPPRMVRPARMVQPSSTPQSDEESYEDYENYANYQQEDYQQEDYHQEDYEQYEETSSQEELGAYHVHWNVQVDDDYIDEEEEIYDYDYEESEVDLPGSWSRGEETGTSHVSSRAVSSKAPSHVSSRAVSSKAPSHVSSRAVSSKGPRRHMLTSDVPRQKQPLSPIAVKRRQPLSPKIVQQKQPSLPDVVEQKQPQIIDAAIPDAAKGEQTKNLDVAEQEVEAQNADVVEEHSPKPDVSKQKQLPVPDMIQQKRPMTTGSRRPVIKDEIGRKRPVTSNGILRRRPPTLDVVEKEGLEDEQQSSSPEMAEEEEATPVEVIDCRAPSLSLWYDDNEPGDVLTQDVYVPASGLTKSTYYCCLQWNSGQNGGGYCGIQDHERGRNYIFSIWDPIGTSEKIQTVYTDTGTVCEPFGGEGTGLKSWNFELGWEPDCWYTFVTRRWDNNAHTRYGLWVKHQISGAWTHVVTVEFPVPDICFNTWTCSFLEDWQGTGQNERRVHFKNGYKRRKADGTWIPFTKAVFGVVREDSSKRYENNFDSGTLDETFYLQSGGTTSPTEEMKEGECLFREMDEIPDELAMVCYLTRVTDESITWDVSVETVPQFQYVIMVDGEQVKEEINSEVREFKFASPPTDVVELVVEDIYGRNVTCKFLVPEGRECYENSMTESTFSAI